MLHYFACSTIHISRAIPPTLILDSRCSLKYSVGLLAFLVELSQEKQSLSRKGFKELVKCLGWEHSEEKTYLKVSSAFKGFSPEKLAQVEPNTLLVLAKNSKRYEKVLDTLRSETEITQKQVDGLMKKCREDGKKEKTQTESSIWRRMPGNGRKYCQIVFHEEDYRVGELIEKAMNENGYSAFQVIEQAIDLREAFLRGDLVWKQQASTDEVVETEVESDSDRSDTESNETEQLFYNQAIEDLLYGDETETQEEEYSSEYLEEPVEDSDRYENEVESPIDILLNTLKQCSTWQPIREALFEYQDYKQQVWQILNRQEKTRVWNLAPESYKKLAIAKTSGVIRDFYSSKDGKFFYVYFPGDCLEYKIHESFVENKIREWSNLN